MADTTIGGERKFPSLSELIDRYVPRHTREEVVEMSIRHEEQVTDLLKTIHQYRERCDAMQKHMAGMEAEYYRKVAIPISFGSLRGEVEQNVLDFTQTYVVTWRPDPYRMSVRLAREPFSRSECPELFGAVSAEFRRRLSTHLVDELERQYANLYRP